MSRQRENYGPKPIILWILVLVMLVAILFVLRSSLFNVTDITVYGCQRFSQQEIAIASGIDYDTNIIEVNKEEAKKNIERNAYLKVENIRRVFPTGIEIYVTERTPIAQIGTVEGYYIIDKDCIALSVNAAQDATLTSILNMGINPPIFGNEISSDDEEKIKAIARLLNSADKYSLTGRISAIDMEDAKNIKLIYDGSVTVFIGNGTLTDTKMARLESTVEAVKDRLGGGKAIHMESEGGYYIK